MSNNKKTIIALLSVIILLLTVYIYDTISFNSYKNEVSNGYKLVVNDTVYQPSNVEGKTFLFHDLKNSNETISLSVADGSVMNIPTDAVLTDSETNIIDNTVDYLADGIYQLSVNQDDIKYTFNLSVDNDFTVEIDDSNAYPSGYLLLSFKDLNEDEEILVEPSFNSATDFSFQNENMIIPIAYQTKVGEYSLKISSKLSAIDTNIKVQNYDFRVSRFNVSSSVSNSASQDPDPDVLAKYQAADLTVSDTAQYLESGFKIPAKGVTTGDFGDIRYINGSSSVSGYHYGIDYANSLNTPIYSTAKGTVVFADFLPATGNAVLIDHGQGVISEYMHLESFNVKVGDQVDQSTVIAYMGTTGYSTGVHLHFEIHVHTVVMNPYLFLENDNFKN